MWRSGLLLLLSWVALPAQAALQIEISGAGETQIPVAIVPLADEGKLKESISSIVSADLARSGLFKLVDPAGRLPHEPSQVVAAQWAGTDALCIGKVIVQPNDRIEVQYRLYDVAKQSWIAGQSVSASADQARAIGHRIADLIYEKLTGVPGVFSTRIAYVVRNGARSRLVVADSDGYNEQTVLALSEPIMSPSWSPDGTHLAYVTFEEGHAAVYVQSLLTNQRRVVANFPGSNSAPTWSPDGRQLAVVVSRDGGAQIWLVRPDGSGARRLTEGGSIDTEPNFSPDGQSLLFASDRGGSVQIYRMAASGGRAERLTFEGSSNFSPRYSPDGKSFVFSHRNGGQFYIAVQDFQTGQMQTLTEGGWDKKPSFAPNGKIVLFATEAQGRGILMTVSSDGRVKQRMSAQSGAIREPVWGPFLKQ
ncbi:MAG: Tol-Pal system beta propeller repeat protein TolB [Pseudomonadota bacterium]